jgi:hypothetical protein
MNATKEHIYVLLYSEKLIEKMKTKIEIDKNCIGCLSLSRVPHDHKAECQYTNGGITSIPNCPCKECLIKMICDTTCENFSTTAKSYKRTDRHVLNHFSKRKTQALFAYTRETITVN